MCKMKLSLKMDFLTQGISETIPEILCAGLAQGS